MSYFCIENHEDFVLLTKNCLQLDKDESTVPTISVFLFAKYVVITTQKNSYMECFSFGQQRFVFAHLFFSDISKKSTKLPFPELETKKFSNDFALFPY